VPKVSHTQKSLPPAEVGLEEPLPHFAAVMEEHGPKDEDGVPTMVLPDFEPGEYKDWMPEVDALVDQEAAEKASQIADEALRHVRDELPPFEYQLDADADDLDYSRYELSWNQPPTRKPIKVKSERLPSPSPRRVAR
jgi:hypothetical protein